MPAGTPAEREILGAVLARVDALSGALDEDVETLGGLPATLADLQSLSSPRRVASRALLKSVEQMEDQLARLFRLLPGLMLVDAAGWYAQDHANFAEKIGILDDAIEWIAIIRLRKRLVHDYPLDAEAQLALLTQAYGAIPTLHRAAAAARLFVETEGLLA